MSHKNLVVDLNNNVFMIRHASVKTPGRNQRKEELVAEAIFKELIGFLVTFAHENQCDSILIACDSKNVWRRDVYPEYKDSSHEDVYYEDCIKAAGLAKEFFLNCTNVSVIEVDRTEADDVIGVFCSESEGVENIILSSDKDFVQLIDQNTRLYAPPQKKFRESEDVGYDLFFKCIRGDRGDNIHSAFPRVRETQLKKAWEDPGEMQNLMETVRKDGEKVGECYEFNKNLIDLTLQPEYIKDNIRFALSRPSQRNFSEFKIMKFLADNHLKKQSDMFKFKYGPLKGQCVWKN